MGIYHIAIIKVAETDDEATYRFVKEDFPYDLAAGVFKILKGTGEVVLLEPMPNDEEQHYYARAARKVYKHHLENDYPGKTFWIS